MRLWAYYTLKSKTIKYNTITNNPTNYIVIGSTTNSKNNNYLKIQLIHCVFLL